MHPPFHIALVEDHDALRGSFVEHLGGDGYEVFGASCAEELDDYFIKNQAQLLILDVNLPGESGFNIARRYRGAYPSIYIIMLTVRAETKDKILGYESGADSYLLKPVSAQELSAAVMSVQRRIFGLIHGQINLNYFRRVLSGNGLTIKISEIEVALIKGLIEAPDRLLEYWRLLEIIQKESNDQNKLALANYISRLNKKLMKIGLPEAVIISRWKVGYQLLADIKIQG